MPKLPIFKSKRGLHLRSAAPKMDTELENADSKDHILKLTETPERAINLNAESELMDISYIKQEGNEATSDINENVDLECTGGNTYIINTKVKTNSNPVSQLIIFPTEDTEPCGYNNRAKRLVDPINIKRVMHESTKKTKPAPGRKQICILCAASNGSGKSKTNVPIKNFAKLIQDFAGVDILTIHSSPKACSSCFKQLRLVDNFKKQIMYTNRLINTTDILEEFRADDILTSGALRSTLDSISENAKEAEEVSVEKKQEESAKACESEDDDWFASDKQDSLDRDGTEIQIVEVESILSKNLSEGEEKKNSKKEKFMCTECGKQYHQLHKLEHHRLIHGDGNQLCHVCGMRFFYELNLVHHLRTHTGEKPFACSYCDRRFSLKWNMHQHRRIHTNALPYKCKLCPNAFRHNVTLKKHIAKSHSALECANAARSDASSVEDNSATDIESEVNAEEV